MTAQAAAAPGGVPPIVLDMEAADAAIEPASGRGSS